MRVMSLQVPVGMHISSRGQWAQGHMFMMTCCVRWKSPLRFETLPV